ncbi:MAG TPA: hypothetical protein VN814_10165 [Caulobacteraceae bacterium]|nr:hypothetical protein [Caulobacteraceae bacterium]
MRKQGFAWLGAGAAIALSAALAFYAPVSRPQGEAAKTTLDDQIIYDGPNLGDIPKPDCIEIAPVSSPNSMTPGSWTGVSENIFSSILARTGIIPGQTDPDFRGPRTVGDTTFPAAPGFIELIDDSKVLNPSVKGGPTSKRMTFGYFVRVTQTIRGTPITREFFLLMSYDYIDQGTPGSNPSAFEVFVFGPLPTPGLYGGADPNALIPLQDGLAVSPDGTLLTAVPANIALVNNYSNKVPPNTQVTPGVEEKGQGCFFCHADRKGDFPDTSPAWTMTFGQFQAAYQTRTGKIDCPPPATSAVLQNSVLQSNVLQGVTGGGEEGGGATGGSQSNGVTNGIGVNPPEPNQPNTKVEGGEGQTGEQGGSQTPHSPETHGSQTPKQP